MHLEDAYYSVRELREAVTWVHEGVAGGKRKLASLLANPDGDDFQRCIYFCLAGRGVVDMIDDLLWLERLIEERGRVAGDVRRRKVGLGALVSHYVEDAPDGPIVAEAEEFPQGPTDRKSTRLKSSD